jgi:hypothetical protein
MSGGMGDLFFGRSNVSRATVVWQNNGHHFPVLILQWNLQLISQSINYGSTDAEASKRAWTGEESDFREIGPVGLIFDKFIMDEGKNLLG